jgi:DNA polymerase-3 subunit alpha
VLYQEQVMRVAGELADFTMGEADVLRRAMGKKKPAEIKAQREKFLTGALKHNIDETVASRIFDIMESFAGYGFNKSHSAAYAMITYQTAYLKAHFPVEYMCAFLTSVIDHQERVVFYLKECRHMSITILPPDINESYENFTVAPDGIRFGLGAIKSIGLNAVKSIVDARQEGLFTSILDFCRRVDLSQINKRVVENLIVAGCFDSLEISRKQALSIMDECMDLAIKIKETECSNQLTLFGDCSEMIEEPVPAFKGELEPHERLSREKEVLGFYVSQNPLDEYREILPLVITSELAQLQTEQEEVYVRVAGMVVNLSRRISKKGDNYARFFLEDFSGRMEMMLFSSAFKKCIDLLQPDTAVIVEGFLNTRDEQPKIVVRKVFSVLSKLKELHIRVDYEKTDDEYKPKLIALLKQFPGDVEVYLHLSDHRILALNEKFNVKADLALKQELALVYGNNNVWFN